jgi:ribosomal-protein-alanine N-acetyltransferase
MELTTDRLLLRPWGDAHRALYARLNADPVVMRYAPHPLSRKESDAKADAIAALQERGAFGLFASQRLDTGQVIGFTVMVPVTFAADFAPATEIGWVLTPPAWGQGFATEAARALAERAFEVLPISGLVAFAVADNARSRAVMRRLGMRRNPAEDFDHPEIPAGSALRRHVLYRLEARRPGAATAAGAPRRRMTCRC